MLGGAAVFYVIAVIASFLGFGEVAYTAGITAKVLFFVFLALFLFTLSAGLLRQLPMVRDHEGPLPRHDERPETVVRPVPRAAARSADGQKSRYRLKTPGRCR
jgi:uncharacterized membrane protein YtjA (UPF0391 family)